jgi:hypothetical protein
VHVELLTPNLAAAPMTTGSSAVREILIPVSRDTWQAALRSDPAHHHGQDRRRPL